MKRLLTVAVVVLLTGFVLPSVALADASVVQDSCQVWTEGNNYFVRIYFTVINFSLPDVLCDLHFTPEPLPVTNDCEILEITSPMGWSGALNPLGGADWWADTPADCITQGTAKSTFSILLDPGFCCYVVDFTGPTGAIMLTQEECFTLCGKVATEESTWGRIKELYSK